ncbi:MAG: EAL domain-containing protein, partial [Gammaproteobacteria bacterium]|nr:EAL domain-containing protein [Gammaproteobacteria bacterium]
PSGFVIDTLTALHGLGVKLGIDDYGHSGASLAQLKQWPVSVLKVDRSFVSNLPHSTDDAAIVRAVVGLGEHLDLSVIAKGVETPQQHDHLTGFGCCYAQGFHYHPPAQPADLVSVLSASAS